MSEPCACKGTIPHGHVIFGTCDPKKVSLWIERTIDRGVGLGGDEYLVLHGSEAKLDDGVILEGESLEAVLVHAAGIIGMRNPEKLARLGLK